MSGWSSGPSGDASTDPVHAFPGGAGYNHILGTMGGSSSGGGEAGWSMSMIIRDAYWIVGPATAQPIPIVVKLHTTGLAGGGVVNLPFGGPFCSSSGATVRIASGSVFQELQSGSTTIPCSGPVALDQTQSIELAYLPLVPFEVACSFYLSNGPQVGISTSSVISFELPTGYTIQSCHGFAGQVVPAALSSWGMIKHTYR